MIKFDKHKMVNGGFKTHVRVIYGYRDKKTKRTRMKTIKSFGYLEDKPDKEKFLKELNEFNDNFMKKQRVVVNKTYTKSFLDDSSSRSVNFGFKYLEAIINELKLDSILNSTDYKGRYSLSDVLTYLVIQRILKPCSKLQTYKSVKNLYDKYYDFSIEQLYRSLSVFAKESDNIQLHLNNKIKYLIGRNTNEVFYDSTNYFFQKDFEDEDEFEEVPYVKMTKQQLKKNNLVEAMQEDGSTKLFKRIPGLLKRGVSKEHVVDPIVQLGLLMDDNGLPINMQIFPGNTSDSKTLLPSLTKVRESYGLKRLIVVADKGMNSSENIDSICNNGDGYVFSQILKGKKGKRYADKIFNESAYKVVSDDYKYQTFIEEVPGHDKHGNEIIRKRKVLIYWNGKAAHREQIRRHEKLCKAEKSIQTGLAGLKHGFEKYVKSDSINDITGEVLTPIRMVDYELAEDDARYDGYFAIITSEIDWDAQKIRQSYHGLWRIEDSFRITKSDLCARPVFVRTEDHIKGHFLICFIALLVLRILQHKMNYSLSVERIVNALNMCECSEISKGIIHVTRTHSINELVEENKQSIEQTVADFKEIIKKYNNEVCVSVMNKKEFDEFIDKIKINL